MIFVERKLFQDLVSSYRENGKLNLREVFIYEKIQKALPLKVPADCRC